MIPPDSIDPAASYPVTNVNKVKRVHDRGRYDKETIHAILDAALVCHIAYVIDGRPYRTPTGFWREGSHLYWHGSSAEPDDPQPEGRRRRLPHRHASRLAGDGAAPASTTR